MADEKAIDMDSLVLHRTSLFPRHFQFLRTDHLSNQVARNTKSRKLKAAALFMIMRPRPCGTSKILPSRKSLRTLLRIMQTLLLATATVRFDRKSDDLSTSKTGNGFSLFDSASIE